MELPDKTHPLADHWMHGEGAYQLKLEKTQFKTSECICCVLLVLQRQKRFKSITTCVLQGIECSPTLSG